MFKAYALLGALLVVGAVAVGNANAATLELDYASTSSPLTITATSEATAQAFVTGSAVAYDGSTPILIEVGAQYVASTNVAIAVLYDGSTPLGWLSQITAAAQAFYATRRLVPTAGSHTYSVRFWKNSGTASVQVGAGGSGVSFPGYMRITRADPVVDSSAGATSLHDLTDVNDAGKGNGDILKYDGTSSKWVAGTDVAGTGGGGSFDWNDLEPWLYILGVGVWFIFGGILALIAAPMMQGAFRWWRA